MILNNNNTYSAGVLSTYNNLKTEALSKPTNFFGYIVIYRKNKAKQQKYQERHTLAAILCTYFVT